MDDPQPISTVAALARVLREGVLHGEYPEGSPMREVQIASVFGVSRNTVREALRLLVMERVLVQQLHRGVTVPRFEARDIADMMRFRFILEREAVQAICSLSGRPPALPRTAVDGPVGAHEAVLNWHEELVREVDSDRVVAAHRQVMNELRVVLASTDAAPLLADPAPRDPLADTIRRHDQVAATTALENLLADDEGQLVRARMAAAEPN